jgi:general stress protein 26
MGDTKNLSGTEAAKKIKEFAKEIDTCMFCTYDGDKLISRPMSSQKVDEQGNIWFLSDKNSEKNKELAVNDKVELLYGQGHDKYLAIKGNASILFDREKIKELWDPIAKIWFKDGVDDQAISVIKVAFTEGYYWDVKHGKMVELAKMATSLVTGKTMDDGIEGKLNK